MVPWDLRPLDLVALRFPRRANSMMQVACPAQAGSADQKSPLRLAALTKRQAAPLYSPARSTRGARQKEHPQGSARGGAVRSAAARAIAIRHAVDV